MYYLHLDHWYFQRRIVGFKMIRNWKIHGIQVGQQVHSSSSGKMTFHWKGPIDDRTFHRSGGGTMAIPRPGFGSAAYKILVSFISWSAGRDWFSNKRWLDQYQNEWRATGTPWILARPSWHHVLFAFMYSPRAFALTTAILLWRAVSRPKPFPPSGKQD